MKTVDVSGQNFLRSQFKQLQNISFISVYGNKVMDSSILSEFRGKILLFVPCVPTAEIKQLTNYVKKQNLIKDKSKIQLPETKNHDLDKICSKFQRNSVFEIMVFIEKYSEDLGDYQEYLFTIMLRKN
jgi:hypothetical protein